MKGTLGRLGSPIRVSALENLVRRIVAFRETRRDALDLAPGSVARDDAEGREATAQRTHETTFSRRFALSNFRHSFMFARCVDQRWRERREAGLSCLHQVTRRTADFASSGRPVVHPIGHRSVTGNEPVAAKQLSGMPLRNPGFRTIVDYFVLRGERLRAIIRQVPKIKAEHFARRCYPARWEYRISCGPGLR